MFARLPGALMRAFLVVVLVVIPSFLLPMEGTDGSMVVVLIALCAAFFTLVEYMSNSPSIVEFRDAPPFNRIRYVALLVTVTTLSFLLAENDRASVVTQYLQMAGERLGTAMDFPFSPVRLLVLMMPENTPSTVISAIRVSGGLAYLCSLASIAVFVIMLRLKRWPRRSGTFNVWINLPRFDPTAGGDVVVRLNKDSGVNLVLGFLLPFVVPAIVKIISLFGGGINLSDPQTLVWVVTAWAFLPASLLMRGVALSRVAQLIHKQRKKAYAQAVSDGLLPA